jgi:DNA-binding NtrC family response regulator
MGGIARILVVDDDKSIRKGLKTVLEDEGYSVDTAETGNEAIEKTKLNFYNLALIDIRLPDMEGIKLLAALKETTPKMVKIIVTGYPTLQNAIEAVNKDADGYLLKPLDIENLLNIIKVHLKKQEEAKKMNEEKFAEFVETRAKEWEEEKIVTRKKTD